MLSSRQKLLFCLFGAALTLGFAVPCLVFAATIDAPLPTVGGQAPPGIESGDVAGLVRYIYIFAMAAAGLAAFGGLIYGGVLYLIAGGSQSSVAKGKERIKHSLYGLGLILASYLILYTINPALVSLSNPFIKAITLKQTAFWSMSSYGNGDADVPLNHPCLTDYDCQYDLACCPVGSTECEQTFDWPNKKSASQEETQIDWHACGQEDSIWKYSPSDTCPEGSLPGKICEDKDNEESCCDLKDRLPERYGVKVTCCQPPQFVPVNRGEDCDCLYGSKTCPAPEPGGKAQTGSGRCAQGCGKKVSTCQKMKIREGQATSLFGGHKYALDDTYGTRCYYNHDWIWNQLINVAFKRDTPRDSCLDYRLICNQFHNICMEPGEQGEVCEYDADCCQEYDAWTPHCRKYTDRHISLFCHPEQKTCTLSKGESGALEQEPKPSHYKCNGILYAVVDGKPNKAIMCKVIDNTYPLEGQPHWCKDVTGYNATKYKCCCKETASPPAAGTLTHQVAVSQLNQADVDVKTGTGAAKLEGIHQETIDEIIGLKSDCNCQITVTEGTGGAHATGTCSHENGWKADIRLEDKLNKFLESQEALGQRSGDNAPMYQQGNAIYAKESDHWDMELRCEIL